MINIYKYITIAGLAVSSAQAAVTLVTYDFNDGTLGATNAGAAVTGSDITDGAGLFTFIATNPGTGTGPNGGAFATNVLQVADASADFAAALNNDAFFSITLSAVDAFSLDTLSFDVTRGGNAGNDQRGFSVASSLTGTAEADLLLSVGAVDGLRPDFTSFEIDLSAISAFDDNIAAGDDITFDFFVHTGGNGFSLEFDNIEFDGVAVPEPSSAMLLGLGATAFLLRRRK